MNVKNAVVVITGGASGIGKAIALDFAKHGARLVLGDLNEEALKATEVEIKALNAEVVWSICNVTSEEDTIKLMNLAISKFGAINVVVPCAGIIKDGLMISTDKETGKVKKTMSLDDFKKVIDINLVGTFLSLREGASRMVDNNCSGVLFTISSVQKVGGVGQLNYSSTKSALAMWPKLLTGEFNMKGINNIRVVSIAPGYVGTDMVKNMDKGALDKIISAVHIKRLIEPSEIAMTIRHVVENDAIDATCIEVTGGTISGLIAK